MEERKRWGFGPGFLAGILVCALIFFAGTKIYTNVTNQYLVIGPQKSGVTASNSRVLNRATVEKLEELLAYMDIYYYDGYDTGKVQNSVLKGLIEGLGDPYSAYYTPDEYADLRIGTTGSYYGIGAGLSQNINTMEVTVTKVYEGTPAEEAGLRNGDRILMVDEIEAVSMELTALVKRIRGEEGTSVHLLVYREDTQESLEFDVTRRNVQLTSVTAELLDGDVGYIQISEFQSGTPKQFENKVEELRAQGMKGVIIDLRGNPGGLITSVVQILDDILPEGILVYTEDKFGNRDTYNSDENCMEEPLVVLVDASSASASEIFAGAVKDYGYGTLVGTTTFGKGIVQTLFPMEDGDAVKVTTAKYFTPNGNHIHGIGIEPDEVVQYDYSGPKDEKYDKRYDNQLQYALEVMREKLN